MADVRKRTTSKGVSYQARVRDPASGEYHYKSFATAREAKAAVQNTQSLTGKGRGSLTVQQATEKWLSICEKIGRNGEEPVEPQTLIEYKRRAKVINQYPWKKAIRQLETPDIIHFQEWLLLNKTRDLARRALSSFHSIMIEMVRQGELKSDPAAGVTVKSGRYEEEDSEVEIPSDQEMRDIYGAADLMGTKNDYMEECWARYRPMIYLAGFSGMRPSEYRGLAWPSVFQDHVTVRQRADKTGIIGPVKSKAAKRTIYLPRKVIDLVGEWEERCPKSNHKLVFPTASGGPIALNNFAVSAWTPLLREAGLTTKRKRANGTTYDYASYSPYCLRHYFASKLIERTEGRDLKLIQETMGHSKIEITMNIYGHLIKGREDSKRRTAEDLAQSIFSLSCGEVVA